MDNKKETFSLNYLFNLIKRKWALVAFVMLIFLAFAIYNAFLKKDVYVVKFCITFILSDRDDLISIKNDLVAIKNDPVSVPLETPTLETIVGNFITKYQNQKSEIENGKNIPISSHIVNFQKLDISPVVNESGDKRTKTLNMSLFVYDTSATKQIVNDLLEYVNQNQQIKKWFEERKKALLDNKEKLEYGLAEMIKYKNNIRYEKSQNSALYFNVYKDIIEVQTEITAIDAKLKKLTPVYITADPVNPSKPAGMPHLMGFIITIILGIFFSFVLIFLLDKPSVKSFEV